MEKFYNHYTQPGNLYNEDLVKSSDLNIELSGGIFLIDLLRLEYLQDLRFDFAFLYLNEISRNSGFTVKKSLNDLKPMQVVLLEDWTVCVYLTQVYCFFTQNQQIDRSRANLKQKIKSDLNLEAHLIEITQASRHTYTAVTICKLFFQSFANIQDLVSNEKFEGFKQSTREDLARFIYSSCKFPAKSLLLKLAQAKELIQLSNSEIPECEEVDEVDLNEEIEENEENEEIYEYEENLPISPYPTGPIIDLNQDVDNWEEPDCKAGFKSVTIEDLQSPDLLIQEFKGQIKPTCELLINYLQRDSLESLEYTQSESTGRVETSFRLSNTITGRFPRLSGSSLAVLETPSKEARKSYTEYIECMESPRFSSKYQSPLKVISSTPVFSPKQAAYTIQEVKNFLIPENEGLNKLSPGEKENLRRSRNNHVKPLSFQDTDSKSLNSELCMSSREYFKPRTVFEEQKISCRCQSCGIF